MKLTFVINDIMSEDETYTTIRLGRRALQMGHDVAFVSLVNFTYEPDESVSALASVPRARHETDAELLADVQGDDAELTKICISDQDVLFLRADPAPELVARPWAHVSSLLFAQLAAKRGVIVLNDPQHLTDASNKTYFQQYPKAIRPVTCITRDPAEIKRFIEDQGGKAVIKPLQGSGGQGVFVITPETMANLNVSIETTVKDGYAIVQEYLPDAADGDLRLITLNGKPLQVDGTYACFRRYNDTGDARSNFSAGGKIKLEAPDERALRLAEICGPKLVNDGMYLAGLDIVGDKMMEINVDTPGGINLVESLTEIDFAGAIIRDMERKVELRDHYRGRLRNDQIAVM
ncbi:glutathione synthase [Parvularcula dongshanensis]|uniref:Glutathione synthase n=1 Tax=Parvularcula dongshanensis TaxID=1173995 RepID=A0A840I6U3_9PROT|nr:glutathione synthase [Parvularcula dongshanensis]MBB4659981.1 glutathione synthase [Parvularcula dongshanensis]